MIDMYVHSGDVTSKLEFLKEFGMKHSRIHEAISHGTYLLLYMISWYSRNSYIKQNSV
jgi:hypothetical protein